MIIDILFWVSVAACVVLVISYWARKGREMREKEERDDFVGDNFR